MKKFTKTLASVLSILGCVLGAGFISGAEINSFFLRFGLSGILGIVISTILFSLIVYFVISASSKKYVKLQNYTKKLNFLPFCQLFISGAMVSGLTKILHDFGINFFLCYLIVFVVLFVCLIVGISSANITNIIVSLFLFLLLPFVIFSIKDFSLAGSLKLNFGQIIPSILFAAMYVAMNAVASNEVIRHAASKKVSAVSVSVFCGIVLLVLMLLIFMVIAGTGATGEMPMLSVTHNPWLKFVYTMLFVVAMLSTLLSSSMGAKNGFAALQSNILESLCTSFGIFSVALIGFNNIVLYAYPCIGVLMIIQVIVNRIRANKSLAESSKA